VVSPFVTEVALAVFDGLLRRGVKCRLITRLNKADFWSRVSNPDVLVSLIEKGVEVKSLRGLHAKGYFADGKSGILTSANLTGGGLSNNYELGLHFTRAECPEAFAEVNGLWEKLRGLVIAERMRQVRDEVAAFRTHRPDGHTDLPEELTDEGEVPADDHDEAEEMPLRLGVDPGTVGSLLAEFKKSHKQVPGTWSDALESDLKKTAYHSISLSSYLWLVGWCNTGHSKKAGMPWAQKLAKEIFGYVPPQFLQVGGNRYDLKWYRGGRKVPFREEFLARHQDYLVLPPPSDTPPE
jgi:hypothetical protein